jgi:hypothetical protein
MANEMLTTRAAPDRAEDLIALDIMLYFPHIYKAARYIHVCARSWLCVATYQHIITSYLLNTDRQISNVPIFLEGHFWPLKPRQNIIACISTYGAKGTITLTRRM